MLSIGCKLNEPARSFGEEDVVGVFRRPFDERYARVVLPVPHRLLKQRLVRSFQQKQAKRRHQTPPRSGADQ